MGAGRGVPTALVTVQSSKPGALDGPGSWWDEREEVGDRREGVWLGEGTRLCWTSNRKNHIWIKFPAGSSSREGRHGRASLKLKGAVRGHLIPPCPQEETLRTENCSQGFALSFCPSTSSLQSASFMTSALIFRDVLM